MHPRRPAPDGVIVSRVDDFVLAATLVRDAAQLAQQMLQEGLTTQYKTSVSDVVSAADHAAEQQVAARLAAERPDDGLVGEEGSRRSGARTWFIDPVDGTYNFLSGIPYWCSAVALIDAAGPVLGAVYYPATDELWLGGRGSPTTLNGVEVAPLRSATLDRLAMSTHKRPVKTAEGTGRLRYRSLVESAAAVRIMGSSSIDLSFVASGRLGVYVQGHCLEWDWLPGASLVTAAGGVAEVFHDGDTRWHVAGNADVVAEVKQALLDREGSASMSGQNTDTRTAAPFEEDPTSPGSRPLAGWENKEQPLRG